MSYAFGLIMKKTKQKELSSFIKKHADLKGIDLLLSDLNGVLRGKRIQPSALEKIFQDGICLPASVFALDILGNTVEETGLGLGDIYLYPIQVKKVYWRRLISFINYGGRRWIPIFC